MPQEDPWDSDASREIARAGKGRAQVGFDSRSDDEGHTGHRLKDAAPKDPEPDDDEEEELEEIEVVPVRRQLSAAIAVFALLLGGCLIFSSETSAPDHRSSFAIVLFGVQLLDLLALTMALRPPAPGATAGISVAVALVADYLSTSRTTPGLLPLIFVGLAGFVAALASQAFRAVDRARLKDYWRTTLVIMLGVVAYAIPISLSRQSIGTQTFQVCVVGAAVALLVSRLTDAVFPKPRIAPQVPRGATGVVLGAMLGTLATAGLGSVLVLPFTPAKGAALGLVAAVVAQLIDLAVNFADAGRRLAGEAPTFWVARHMQGPLGAFALVAPVAYALAHWYMS